MQNDKGPLFRTIDCDISALTRTPLLQANADAATARHATIVGVAVKGGSHGFRATGITAYLRNGGTLETASARQHPHHAALRSTPRASTRSSGSGCGAHPP